MNIVIIPPTASSFLPNGPGCSPPVSPVVPPRGAAPITRRRGRPAVAELAPSPSGVGRGKILQFPSR